MHSTQFQVRVCETPIQVNNHAHCNLSFMSLSAVMINLSRGLRLNHAGPSSIILVHMSGGDSREIARHIIVCSSSSTLDGACAQDILIWALFYNTLLEKIRSEALGKYHFSWRGCRRRSTSLAVPTTWSRGRQGACPSRGRALRYRHISVWAVPR